MNLSTLIQRIYGIFTLTGLYSFEFVDKNRNTIVEIFFMMPPKSKTMSEGTRSATVATFGGNYTLDGGNSTKEMSLSGELFFPYIGSPDNPVAKDNAGLENLIDGMTEFFKLRYMLIRYRDYTMTKNAKITNPISVIELSSKTNRLHRRIAKNIKNKLGALYDEIRLIIHDYDMDDHFYCRVKNFTGRQSDTKYLAVEYTIELECFEVDQGQKTSSTKFKQPVNENIDVINTSIQKINFPATFNSIKLETELNAEILSNCFVITDYISRVNTENQNIQSGKSTAFINMPLYISQLLSAIAIVKYSFIRLVLSTVQLELYYSFDLTLDDVISVNLLSFYNSLLKLEIQFNSMKGILNSTPQQNDVRYYSNADDYTLTTDQFDSGDENAVESNTNFLYYTVMEGDTSRIIALRELNDINKFINILKVNNITENDFIDGTLIGEQIKIPMSVNTPLRGNDNLVYESDFNNSDKFLYGSDIAVGNDKGLLPSAKGDLLNTVGIENVYTNIENKIKNLKGSLNVYNPNWGSVAIDDGNAPLIVKLNRYIMDVISQIQSDPRVESVKPDLSKLIWKGETITLPSTIYFIGSDQSREVTIE